MSAVNNHYDSKLYDARKDGFMCLDNGDVTTMKVR